MSDDPIVDPVDPVDPAPADPIDPAPVDPPADPVDPVDPPVDPVDPSVDPEPAEPYFKSAPEDWRDQAVAAIGLEGDEASKMLKHLARFSTPEAAFKAGHDSAIKIRSGEISTGLPEDPTDEQMQEYREANGIPETSEGYELSLDEGLILGEEDQGIMPAVFDMAHKHNLSSEAMSDLTNAMLVGRQAEMDKIYQQDGLDEQSVRQALKEQWGNNTDANLNMFQNFLNKIPESAREDFANARLDGGLGLVHSPELVMYFADIERQINPLASVMPSSDSARSTLQSEFDALTKRMGDDDWHNDKAANERWKELHTALNQ